ncbi:glycosyltransferase family 2 protein [Vibrio sp. A2-1]|uniref:glycosyltransferase family 2 protein n=1 Tax=Vibrio sp. A2-1 TaxID=2912252 RepID=UPI001F3997BA|nr:glycosyltransferase family 2 protein [Vibrio sp. A2-1]MCF7487637.1 glycosyltransferase family 2 protein [Vibrio sp. A2-1]
MSIKVTVCCVSYNHEKYLKSTLDGILNQETDFEFEVLVYDDCSTDGSRTIIDQYKDESIHRFKTVYSEENNYSNGIRPLSFLIPLAEGDYIAFCEGDDYWIDPKKLQKQFDALEKNKDIDICFHRAHTLENKVISDKGYGYYGDLERVISIREVIKFSGGVMPMASIFIRANKFKALFETERDFFKRLLRHSAIQIINSDKNGALYLPDIMSVYRFMHPGSWSRIQESDKLAQKNSFIEFCLRNKALNRITERRYWLDFKILFLKRMIRYLISIVR